MTAARLFVGLMSGTSLDGVDGVLAEIDIDREGRDGRPLESLRAHVHRPYDSPLRESLHSLNDAGGVDELHRAAVAANGVAAAYARVVSELLASAGIARARIVAIGAHGQTVRHRPAAAAISPAEAYTVQLLNGALLAELAGIDVVCDLRSRDLAAGGQGAPLAPAFHAAMFSARENRAVLNLGGIANLTLLPASGNVTGFDCGPGNTLLDGWCRRHSGCDHDDGGRWAASARPDAVLLRDLLAEPYFEAPAPKSTGRDLFHQAWLDARLARHAPASPAVVQSTLAELTATTIADALRRHAPDTRRVFICGGGAFNTDLIGRIARLLPDARLATTEALGLPPMQVEAAAFAWLAARFFAGRPANLPSVTGASGERRLGALYPAR